jgi:SAM-dependent methyltransferase
LAQLGGLRARFDNIYDTYILPGEFDESNEYYRLERERYWRSLQLLCELDIKPSESLLEIGGGQLMIIFKQLFGNDCTVGDIRSSQGATIKKAGLRFVEYNLINEPPPELERGFDVVVLLEVVEHIPFPIYWQMEHVRRILKPNGIVFLTTPNVFRVRNLVRMIAGIDFLDRFEVAEEGRGLGHQLEYSADHLRWQLAQANLKIIRLDHDGLGHRGHSPLARVGRALLSPLRLRPKWRDGLVAAARFEPKT